MPAAGLLEPYDPRPVFELRRALEGVDGVPVPTTLWLDEQGEASGRPLYVVEKVAGEVPTQWTSDSFFADDEERRATARQLMGIAAALHAAPVELAPGGLRGSGETGFEVVELWHELYRRDCLEPVPALDWGFAWLERNRDQLSGRRAILHGDLRTGNYLVRDGRIVAMLDFEDAHVGDPVQDLAHCALRLFRGRTRQPSGLVPLGELLAMYEEAAGWTRATPVLPLLERLRGRVHRDHPAPRGRAVRARQNRRRALSGARLPGPPHPSLRARLHRSRGRRARARMTTSAGYSGCRYGTEHEALQPPGEHESHNDSVYFNLTPADGAGVAGAVVRIGMRPGEGYSEASVVLPRG